jgi:class 3 adenylate cyclase
VCVFFSDVRDFTTLSENMPPVVVTTVITTVFRPMVKAVHRYDGTVDKFIGDGMMVLFGAPRKSEDPCGDAVQCALSMMEGLDALNEEFRREGMPTLTIGIGINFGIVTVGNIGSSERHNYSAIGDAVNVAARLEGLTKDPRRKILITEAVVERIGERFQFDPLGSHKVKGHKPGPHLRQSARCAPASAAWKFGDNNKTVAARMILASARLRCGEARSQRNRRLRHQPARTRSPSATRAPSAAELAASRSRRPANTTPRSLMYARAAASSR